MGGGAVHSVPVHVRYSFGGSSLVKFHTHPDLCGSDHTVLLRSDGIVVVAIGSNDHGQCNIPSLDEGMTYTQVAAGFQNTVLLRVMAALLLLVRMIRDNATSRLWMRE